MALKRTGKSAYVCKTSTCGATGGCSYFLGFLGAAIYYMGIATSFWGVVVGFFKALVWPVFLVYAVLKFVGA